MDVWNPSCEATPFDAQSGLSRGGPLIRMASQKGFQYVYRVLNN